MIYPKLDTDQFKNDKDAIQKLLPAESNVIEHASFYFRCVIPASLTANQWHSFSNGVKSYFGGRFDRFEYRTDLKVVKIFLIQPYQ